jgi:hypothetical protein
MTFSTTSLVVIGIITLLLIYALYVHVTTAIANKQNENQPLSNIMALLSIDNDHADFINGLSGGEILNAPTNNNNNVLEYESSNNNINDNNNLMAGAAAPQEISPLIVTLPVDMSSGVYNWVKSCMDGKVDRKSISIIFTHDDADTIVLRKTYGGCVLSEIQMPALDAASKDVAYMVLKISPTTLVTDVPASWSRFNHPLASASPYSAALASKFALEIDGIQVQHVSKIDSFSIKQSIGGRKGSVADLSFTCPESETEQFRTWLKGASDNNGGTSTSTVAPAMKTGTVKFFNEAKGFKMQIDQMQIYAISKDAANEGMNRVHTYAGHVSLIK